MQNVMEEFMVTVHAQMRLASSLDTLTYATNIFLTLSTAILGVVLWQNGKLAWEQWLQQTGNGVYV